MKAILCALAAGLGLAAPAPSWAKAWQPPAGLVQIPLWPGAAPDAVPAPGPESSVSVSSAEFVAGKPWTWVTDVSSPTLTVFPAQSRNTGAAVVVFPGGGFMGLAMDLEGTEVCRWLTPLGVTCALLKYRVPRSEDYWDEALRRRREPKAPTAFEDAQRAISLLRFRAARWGVAPDKIGVIGFSAGGYLAAKTAADFSPRAYPAQDAADQESCRPDFSMLVYPGHLWRPRGGQGALTLNPALRVTRRTPPTFIVQAEDDRVDGVSQALAYYVALKDAGVPVEMHLYARGGHAFGLRRTARPITRWPRLARTWLQTIGMIGR